MVKNIISPETVELLEWAVNFLLDTAALLLTGKGASPCLHENVCLLNSADQTLVKDESRPGDFVLLSWHP